MFNINLPKVKVGFLVVLGVVAVNAMASATLTAEALGNLYTQTITGLFAIYSTFNDGGGIK